MATVNIAALLFIIMYYFAVMIVGVWGGRKTTSRSGCFVANRDLPLFLGIGSMTATWVGGGYLNGTAEAVYKYGIINCHAPIGYAMSLVLGGAFFATKMRLSDSLTMLDPFQTHYGRWSGLLFCVPAVLGEIFWTAAILAALGDTASVIIRVEASYFIIISGSVIFLYTALGGLYSVTYTDALQVATTGLLLYTDWIGTVAGEDITQLLDFFLMTALGGIPWQVYFQRVLSCPTVTEAKILSFMAAIGCILLAVPPVLIGVTAKHTNFTIAGYPHSYELNDVDSPRVLPFTIVYLTSGMTAIFGLVSIAAAVMSSADSSMLSASTMITRNVYQTLLRPAATELEVVITLRIMICALGSLSVYMALSGELGIRPVDTVLGHRLRPTLPAAPVRVLLQGDQRVRLSDGFHRGWCVPVPVRRALHEHTRRGAPAPVRPGGGPAVPVSPAVHGPWAVHPPAGLVRGYHNLPSWPAAPSASTCSNASSSGSLRRIYEIARSTKPAGTASAAPDNIRRALTTDAAVPEKEAPNNTPGAAKDNRKSVACRTRSKPRMGTAVARPEGNH
ncbi:hypothetical protein MRX96_034156 [Rhipicephalus microplus]